MKVVILCGGMGTRLGHETELKPKPMVQIGGKPILWHIMHIYAQQGFNDFMLALGHKGSVIKEYFLNYYELNSNFTIDLSTGDTQFWNEAVSPWRVSLIDTGQKTMTGGRLLRLKKHLAGNTFMMTYGDGVANIDLNSLVDFHRSHGKLCTMTAVKPTGRFGTLKIKGKSVSSFKEKVGEGWINGGFFMMEPEVLNYISDDTTTFENFPLEELARSGELMAYKHEGFWQCMDTARDKEHLDQICSGELKPW